MILYCQMLIFYYFVCIETSSSLFSLAQKKLLLHSFLWRKENLFFTLFFGAKKRDKRNIHPNPSFPYMGRLNRIPELARLPVAFPLVALKLR